MRSVWFVICSAAALAACSQSAENGSRNSTTSKEKPREKTPYCFFKDQETKGWSAAREGDGNIIVKGKAYRSDARYKAVLDDAGVRGSTAEVRPSIVTNDTGYAAEGDWWDVTATIPGSRAVNVVEVRCGKKTLAELKVAPAK